MNVETHLAVVEVLEDEIRTHGYAIVVMDQYDNVIGEIRKFHDLGQAMSAGKDIQNGMSIEQMKLKEY